MKNGISYCKGVSHVVLYAIKKDAACKRHPFVLSLQLERVFDALYLAAEHLVYFQSCLHLRTAVNYGGVVASADELSYPRGRHLGVFLREIHRHLARHNVVALAAAAHYGRGGYVEMVANGVEDVVHSERFVVYFYGALYNP